MNHSTLRRRLLPLRWWLALAIAGFGVAGLIGHARAADDKPAPQKEKATAEAPRAAPVELDEEWDNPDLPGFLRGKVDLSDYQRLRQEAVDERRGLPMALTPENPHPRVDAIRAMETQERLIRRRFLAAGLAPPTWTPVGPAPIPNGQTTTVEVPVNGRVSAIAVHPTNPSIVYVGAAQGGVFRSLDGGNTWTSIFDGATSQAIGALAIAPSQPSTLYVGTGEPNLSGDSFFGVGLYRIDNADSTPVLNGPINPQPTTDVVGTTTFTGRTIAAILVHPTDPDTVFVGTATGIGGLGATAFSGTVPPLALRGLYRTTNGTAAPGSVNFAKLTVTTSNSLAPDTTGNVNVMDLKFEPGNPSSLIATVYGVAAGDGGVYTSTNALDPTPSAVTFTQTKVLAAGTRANLAVNKVGSVVTVALATGEGSNFVGSSCPPSNDAGRVYVSTDVAQTFTLKPGGAGFCGGQCFYDMPVAIDPNDANLLFVGGAGNGACSRTYSRSTDGGATFSGAGVADVGLHADAHAIAIAPAPNNNIIYEGSDGGIFRSNDGGASWTSLNNSGFNAAQFTSVALHPTDREFMIGGTQDNGTHFKRPDGSWWRADFGDGGFARIDQNATDTDNVTMYHTYFNQTNAMGFARVDRAADAREGNWPFFGCGFVAGTNGLNCSPAATAILFYAPVELGPGTPNTVYFGSDRLFRSANKGGTMTLVSQGPIQSGVAVSAIGISPQNDNVRIVGMRFGKVFATTTGTTPLTDITGPWTTGNVNTQPRPFVSRAVVDPNDANTAYVTFATYCASNVACAQVWKTTNLNGAPPTWTKANNGIPDAPVNAFVVDPRNSMNLYAGSDIGVFASTDGGLNWAAYGGALPRAAVFDLALHRPTGTLRAVTHGRGMWEVRVGAATPVFSNLSSPVIVSGSTPTALGGTIKAGSLTPTGSVQITLNGVTLSSVINSDGTFSASFDTSGLAPGAYPIGYAYAGAPGDYNPAIGSGTLTVVSSLAFTTTTISAPAVTYPSDANVTVTVASSSGTPTGNVSLVVDGGAPRVQALAGGSTTFLITRPSGGSHSLVATYARNATWEGSSASGTLTVNKATPTFSSVLFPTINQGQTPSIPQGVILAGGVAPTGEVLITLNGETRSAAISGNGQFSTRFDTTALAVGTYTISYDFAGNANFLSASNAGKFNVVVGAPTAFSNPNAIVINDVSPATPYPSVINVSGVAGKVLKATVTLTNFSHTFVGDVGMLLVGPDGRSTVLFWNPNNGTAAANFNYTFDDAGPSFTGATGTYRPTQVGAVPNFPGGAPAGPYGTNLFLHNGESANGDWKLYLEDHGGGDTGNVAGGWTLTLTTGGAVYNDFNKDGRTDLLWRNLATGENQVWFMSGTPSPGPGLTLIGGAVLMPIADTNWTIGGTADFNADGLTDILWRNKSSGVNLVWYMDGTSVIGGAFLPTIADTNWIIAATGDFNNDGQRDILWRNTSTGDNIVWFMNGVTLTGGAVLPSIADTNWVVGGTGDFSGDGLTDILWRNQVTGSNIVWNMTGTTLTSGSVLLSVTDTNWFIEAIGDFTADGRADIVWRNQSTGSNQIWEMNNTTIVSGNPLIPVPDPAWTIRGPR